MTSERLALLCPSSCVLSSMMLMGFMQLKTGKDVKLWHAILVLPNGITAALYTGKMIGRKQNVVLHIQPKALGRGYIIVQHPTVFVDGVEQFARIKIEQQ